MKRIIVLFIVAMLLSMNLVFAPGIQCSNDNECKEISSEFSCLYIEPGLRLCGVPGTTTVPGTPGPCADEDMDGYCSGNSCYLKRCRDHFEPDWCECWYVMRNCGGSTCVEKGVPGEGYNVCSCEIPQGGENQPCYNDGSCDSGLWCSNGYCCINGYYWDGSNCIEGSTCSTYQQVSGSQACCYDTQYNLYALWWTNQFYTY